jgi:hypothetical protein
MSNILFKKSKSLELNSKIIKDFCARLEIEYAGRAMLQFEINSHTCFTLSIIVVATPRCGLGSEIIKRITDFCDETGASCELTPSDDFGTPYYILIEFYRKMGFVTDKYSGFRMIYSKNVEISLFSHFLSY